MDREDIVRRIDEQDAAFNRRDVEGIAAIYADDARLLDQAVDGPLEGRDALKDYIGSYVSAFSDFHWERVGLEIDGNDAVEQWRVTGTHDGDLPGLPPTNKRVSVEGCSVLHFQDDGLVHQEENYWDEAALLRQLGAMPATAATG